MVKSVPRRSRQLTFRRSDVTKRSRPEARLSFAAFLSSPAYRRSRWRVIDEATNRMRAADIGSRAELMRFVRESFPEEFSRYHYANDCTGKEATERLWADYLRWLHWRQLGLAPGAA